MLDGDVAQTLGAVLREDLGVTSEILSIDGVVLWDFDYIDLGRIRMPSNTVPVTIKSLIFSEDPRNPRGQHRLHHHGHDHHHGHGHHHGHDTITLTLTRTTMRGHSCKRKSLPFRGGPIAKHRGGVAPCQNTALRAMTHPARMLPHPSPPSPEGEGC